MKRTYSLLITAAFTSLLGGAGCSSYPGLSVFAVDNPNNCEKNPSLCLSAEGGESLVCDAGSKRCTQFSGKCTTEAQCASFEAAACMAGVCVSCMADMECGNWSEARRENRRYCVASKCQQCRDNAGCDPASATPTCDTTQNGAGTFACRACRIDSQNADCASGICGDGGKCVSPTDVVFVNNDMSKCTGGDGSLDKPFCTLALGLAAGKAKIKLAGSAAAYATVTFNNAGGNVEIIGPGRNTSPAATINGVVAQKGTLTLSGLSVNASTTNAIPCDAGATVKIQDAIVSSAVTMGRAVFADLNCVRVNVERSKLSATRNAIFLNDGGTQSVTRYRIVNNAIVNTGLAGSDYAVFLGDGSAGYFGFNSVVKNGGGVQCNSNAQTVSSSIVVQNTLAEQISSKCLRLNNILMASQVDLSSVSDPLLLDTANNATNVIDKGGTQNDINNVLNTLGEAPVTTDYFGKARFAGAGADIGYHELK